MFVDSNGMAIQCKILDIIDTVEICDADVHCNPSPSSKWKPSTTLAYGTERCHGEVVVEKHFWTENTGLHQYDAHHIEKSNTSPTGQGGERDRRSMDNQSRVKVVQTEQQTVGLQASQVLMDLVTRQDDEDREELIQGKPPQKPPDKPMSVPESKKTIKDDRQVPRVVQVNYLPHFQCTQKYMLILPAAQNSSTPNINLTQVDSVT
jgi:hypothetical protein